MKVRLRFGLMGRYGVTVSFQCMVILRRSMSRVRVWFRFCPEG